MQFSVSSDDRTGRATVSVEGEIRSTLRDEMGKLVKMIEELAAACPSPTDVSLDLGGVGYIDSMGMGALLQAFMTLKRSGTGMQLINVNETVHSSLSTAGLTRLLTIEGIPTPNPR